MKIFVKIFEYLFLIISCLISWALVIFVVFICSKAFGFELNIPSATVVWFMWFALNYLDGKRKELMNKRASNGIFDK